MAEENKKKSAVDKMIMGAIIGTAIGSAIGVTMAPKKGNEMRDLAKETGTGVFKVAKKLWGRLFKKNKKQALHSEEMKAIPHEMEILPPGTSVPLKDKHE
jgi:gas vesicle protein